MVGRRACRINTIRQLAIGHSLFWSLEPGRPGRGNERKCTFGLGAALDVAGGFHQIGIARVAARKDGIARGSASPGRRP